VSLDRPAWRRAAKCVSEHNCVEFADFGTAIAVRDSVEPAIALTFTAYDWRSFVGLVKGGLIDGHQSVDNRVAPGTIGS